MRPPETLCPEVVGDTLVGKGIQLRPAVGRQITECADANLEKIMPVASAT